jgi:hypothetical protein
LGRELQTVQSTRTKGTELPQLIARMRIKASIIKRPDLTGMTSTKAHHQAVSWATARNRVQATSAAGNITIKALPKAASKATDRHRDPVTSAAGNITIKAHRRDIAADMSATIVVVTTGSTTTA